MSNKNGGVEPRGRRVALGRWGLALVVATGLVLAGTKGGTPAPRPVATVADPVVAAAGDIACDPLNPNFNGGQGAASSCHQQQVSDLLVNRGLTAVLDLGDNQYYCGGYAAFMASYDKSWGRVKSITHPSVGNHEYITDPGSDRTGCDPSNTQAAGYYKYFGAAAGNPGQGYYSYDIGSWHAIVLNSSCGGAGGCGPTTPQGQWLRADLAAHKNFCTLAYWHIPLYSSGGRASATYKTFWDALYAADADLVLAGHDHLYERFAPQDPNGNKDTTRGLREFVVGTGGANHTSFTSVWPNSEVRNSDTFGVLRLTLHATSYDWQFVPEAGKTFTDSGTTACHGGQGSTPPPPTTPSPKPPAPGTSPPPPGPTGGTGGTGGTAQACSLVVDRTIRVQSARTSVIGSLGANCGAAGTDRARWDVRRQTSPVGSFSFTRGSPSSTWNLSDATPRGSYEIVPAGAFDDDAVGGPRSIPQNTLTASVRLGSWLTLGARRSGRRVVLHGRATRWSPSAGAPRPWRHQAVHILARSCPSCALHVLATSRTNHAGRFSLRVFSPKVRRWSARTASQPSTWGARPVRELDR